MNRMRKNYSKLWTSHSSDKHVSNLPKSTFSADLQSLDLESDLSTSTDEYAKCIAQGMIALIEKGLNRKELVESERFFEKLMDLGKSIMNGSRSSEDLFTLGMLIEAKISKNFLSAKFYKLILKTLFFVRRGVKVFTQEFITNLKRKIDKEAYHNHLDYFYHYKECS